MITRKEQTRNAVEFNGIAHRLLAVPDDFFSGFGEAMPGDLLSDFVQVSNTTGRKAEVWFRAEAENGDELHDQLLQQLELTVSIDGNQLYRGPLQAKKLSKDISLLRLSPGQAGRLDFSVKVPETLNNAYALSRTDVKWVFTVREEDTDPTSSDAGTPSGSSGQPAGQEASGERAVPVKTKDSSQVLLWLGVWLTSFAMIFFGVVLQKGGKRK